MGAPRTGELLAKLENTARWQAVKAWELMQEFGLERHASALHAASGEQRSWYPTYGFVSEASPWPPEAPLEEAAAPARSRLAHLYAANAWLAAGAVVHAGSRRHVGSYPLDWAVAQLVERKLQAESGHTRIGRTLALTVKGMQEADNGVGPGTPERGWTFRYANPTPLVSAPAEAWREVSATNRTAIVEAVLSAWLARASAFSPQSYARSEEASQWASPFDVPPADHVPRPRLNGPYPDQLREIIPTLRPLGVDGAIVDALCDFAAAMWPRGDWGALKR
jgi:hypothetical protein